MKDILSKNMEQKDELYNWLKFHCMIVLPFLIMLACVGIMYAHQ
ncbi:MAG TPA: hypothetical protein VMW43_02820 [Bacteroidota bacterium]|nr:hypothetical protein [Bacteroidota bacterium]